MAKRSKQPPPLSPAVLSISKNLFDLSPGKAERRVVQILEGAIQTYIKVGIENTNFYSISRTCKVSRPLIQHYFASKEQLFEKVAQYIRINFQQIAVDAISSNLAYRDRLKAYVESLFTWRKKFPKHAKVWNLVYFYAAVDLKSQQLHSELAQTGFERITALLKAGAKEGEFAKGDYGRRAKLIQTMYTGGLITVSTESNYADNEGYRKSLIDSCLTIALNK